MMTGAQRNPLLIHQKHQIIGMYSIYYKGQYSLFVGSSTNQTYALERGHLVYSHPKQVLFVRTNSF